MWLILDSLKEIEKYVIGDNNLFVVSNSKIESCEVKKLPFCSCDGYNPIFLTYNSFIFYSNYDNKLFEFDGVNDVESKIDFTGSLRFNFHSLFIVIDGGKTNIIDFDTKNILKTVKSKLSRAILTSNYLVGQIGRKGKEVLFYDIKKDLSFKIDLESKLNQIVNIKDELVLFLYDDKTISCIDLKTKEEVWNKQLLEGISNKEIIQDIHFDLLNSFGDDTVYFLAQNYLLEFKANSESPLISIRNYNENSELDWYFKDSRLYEDYITFTGSNVLGKFPMVAGVIDKKTKEVLWSVKCESGIYFEEAPQIKGNKLYILDSKKTLHIFECTI